MLLPYPEDLDAVADGVFQSLRQWTRQQLFHFPWYAPSEVRSLGIAVADASSVVGSVSSRHRFTLMSVVKPLLFQFVLETHGSAAVLSRVGQEPSDMPYYSVDQLMKDGVKPRNPMLNSGAMALAAMLPGSTAAEQVGVFQDWLKARCGLRPKVDEAVLAECLEDKGESENRQLASLLAGAGYIANEVLTYEVYFQLCCLSVHTQELAVLGRILAFPPTEMAQQATAQVLRVMANCGLYEESLDWHSQTGLYSKSGVSGALLTIFPGKGTLATFNPWLKEGGNPLLAMLATQAVAGRLS